MTETKITHNHDIIFLVGYMCSGKSSIGKVLSRKLDRKFYDLDALIERTTGRRITTIFKEDGERQFREIERETLAKLLDDLDADAIISLGGGTPCFHDNAEWIKAMGRVVWLDITPSAVVSRLKGNKRPILNDHKHDALIFIDKHMRERLPFYGEAHFKVNAEQPILDVVQEIINNVQDENYES